jgi:hypothetical protein
MKYFLPICQATKCNSIHYRCVLYKEKKIEFNFTLCLLFSKLKCLIIYSLNRNIFFAVFHMTYFGHCTPSWYFLKNTTSEAGTLSFLSVKGRHVTTHFILLEDVSFDTCKRVHLHTHKIVLYVSDSVTCHSCAVSDTLRAISICKIPSRSTFQTNISLCCHCISICVNNFFTVFCATLMTL